MITHFAFFIRVSSKFIALSAYFVSMNENAIEIHLNQRYRSCRTINFTRTTKIVDVFFFFVFFAGSRLLLLFPLYR